MTNKISNGLLTFYHEKRNCRVQNSGTQRAGRVGRAQGGWQDRATLGRTKTDISMALEANRPSGPPGRRKKMCWTSLCKLKQRKPYVNLWRNKTSGWPAVYMRFIGVLSPGPRVLSVYVCWQVYRRLFVPVNLFYARHVRELLIKFRKIFV